MACRVSTKQIKGKGKVRVYARVYCVHVWCTLGYIVCTCRVYSRVYCVHVGCTLGYIVCVHVRFTLGYIVIMLGVL